jgi:MSHA biogenesis protein MshN
VSVVNKMLRDLDQRQVTRSADTAIKQGTHSVAGGEVGVPTSPMGRRIGLVALLCLVLGALAWYMTQTGTPGAAIAVATPPPPAILPAPVVLEVATASPPDLVAEPVALPPSPQPVAVTLPVPVLSSAPALASPQVEVAPSQSPVLRKQSAVPAQAASARSGSEAGAASQVSLRMASMLSTRQLAALEVEPKAPAAAKPATPAKQALDTAPNSQRQQQASVDALSQAQTLWSAGSHAAAIDLVQQAVDAAERAVKADSSPPGNPVLQSLVRELTRMQMAQGRYGSVWDLLSRLEPVLGNAPDLWGLRGNTAQRLGRHADSVHAYTVALQSRPNEQRWMLGAAVSLAALGQTDKAAAMADKAQGVGEISREVQTYLQQMGVPLKPR